MQEFEQWFYGTEEGNASLRAEYFYQDVVDPMGELNRMSTLRDWLEAAFDAGKKAGKAE